MSAIAAQLRGDGQVAAVISAGRSLSAGHLGAARSVAQPLYAWIFAAATPVGHSTAVTTLVPLVIAAGGLVAVVAAVGRVAGAWAAGLALSLGVGGSPLVVVTVLAPGFHGVAWCMAGLLGLLTVSIAGRRQLSGVLTFSVLAGAVAGAAAATDPLVLAAGAIPLVLAVAWMALGPARDRAAGLALLATVGPGAAAYAGLSLWMRGAGYASAVPVVQGDAGVAARGLVDLADGLPTGGTNPLGTVVPVVLACAALAVVATAVVMVAVRVLRGPRGDAGTAAARSAEAAHLVFWVSGAVAVLGAILLFPLTIPEPVATVEQRLLSTQGCVAVVFLAAVALVPLWSRRARGRAVAAVLASLFIAASMVRLVGATTDNAFSAAGSSPQSASFAEPGHQRGGTAAALDHAQRAPIAAHDVA